MENASKALIIAGAILVAILLISIGVIVINSTGNMQDQVKDSSDSMAIQTFNAQFTPYDGTNLTAAQVKQLKNIANSNGVAIDTTLIDPISNTGSYTATFEYDTSTHKICKITVKSATTPEVPAGT